MERMDEEALVDLKNYIKSEDAYETLKNLISC